MKVKSFLRALKAVASLNARPGWCPICEGRTLFVKMGSWLRDRYLCARCRSIPRQRALIAVLASLHPGYRRLAIHESSPGGPASGKLARECPGYSISRYFPDMAPGARRDGVRCENLERMTFPEASFDIFITQDVLEHVLDPESAFREIGRVLKPGGSHIFTVPCRLDEETLVRARKVEGGVEHLAEKVYHMDPIDPMGCLVATDWGRDLPDRIHRASGLTTTVQDPRDRKQGLEAEFLEVFVTRRL